MSTPRRITDPNLTGIPAEVTLSLAMNIQGPHPDVIVTHNPLRVVLMKGDEELLILDIGEAKLLSTLLNRMAVHLTTLE